MPFTPTPTIGDDVLTDTTGDESVDALAGNDQITVTGGIDTVNGGTGSDRLIINYSANGSAVSNASGPTVNGSLGGFNGSFSNFVDRSVNFTSIEHFTITTGAGADTIITATGNDIVTTGGGNDFVDVGSGTDQADGGTGEDGISANLAVAASAILWNLQTNSYSGAVGTSFTNFEYFGTVSTGTGNDVIVTRNIAASETIILGDGDDSVTVLNGSDVVNGGAGNDILYGEAGRDEIIGDAGIDQLFGGADGDYFEFNVGDSSSNRASADRIMDFSQAQGDLILFVAGTSFIGTTAFSNVAGQIRFDQSGGNTFVEIDIDGNGVADEMVRIDGLVALTESDFLLV